MGAMHTSGNAMDWIAEGTTTLKARGGGRSLWVTVAVVVTVVVVSGAFAFAAWPSANTLLATPFDCFTAATAVPDATMAQLLLTRVDCFTGSTSLAGILALTQLIAFGFVLLLAWVQMATKNIDVANQIGMNNGVHVYDWAWVTLVEMPLLVFIAVSNGERNLGFVVLMAIAIVSCGALPDIVWILWRSAPGDDVRPREMLAGILCFLQIVSLVALTWLQVIRLHWEIVTGDVSYRGATFAAQFAAMIFVLWWPVQQLALLYMRGDARSEEARDDNSVLDAASQASVNNLRLGRRIVAFLSGVMYMAVALITSAALLKLANETIVAVPP
jgi:hypothetical protein